MTNTWLNESLWMPWSKTWNAVIRSRSRFEPSRHKADSRSGLLVWIDRRRGAVRVQTELSGGTAECQGSLGLHIASCRWTFPTNGPLLYSASWRFDSSHLLLTRHGSAKHWNQISTYEQICSPFIRSKFCLKAFTESLFCRMIVISLF